MKRTALKATQWTEKPHPFAPLIRCWQGSTGCTALVSAEPAGLHISVSATGRYPTWDELASARDRFGTPEQRFVMHFPPHAEYVNAHETCLHLWEAA